MSPKREIRKELEKDFSKNYKGTMKDLRTKCEAMLWHMDHDQGFFPDGGYEFEAMLMLIEMIEKHEENIGVAKDTLIGIHELSKVYENELYGSSYKGKCRDQGSRIQAINKGARIALKSLGYNVEENITPIEVNPNQMDLFGTETKNEE